MPQQREMKVKAHKSNSIEHSIFTHYLLPVGGFVSHFLAILFAILFVVVKVYCLLGNFVCGREREMAKLHSLSNE